MGVSLSETLRERVACPLDSAPPPAIALLNWQVIDAGNTPPHESVFVELPIFIAVGTEPVAGIIMPFVSKPDSNSVVSKSPKLFDKTVVQFFKPLTCQELYDRLTTG